MAKNILHKSAGKLADAENAILKLPPNSPLTLLKTTSSAHLYSATKSSVYLPVNSYIKSHISMIIFISSSLHYLKHQFGNAFSKAAFPSGVREAASLIAIYILSKIARDTTEHGRFEDLQISYNRLRFFRIGNSTSLHLKPPFGHIVFHRSGIKEGKIS